MEKDDNNAKPIVKNCLIVEKSFSFPDRKLTKNQINNNANLIATQHQFYRLILENNASLKLIKNK